MASIENEVRVRRGPLGTALAAALAVAVATQATGGDAAEAAAPVQQQRVIGALTLNAGEGTLVTLPAPMSDLFIADEKVADVQVRSPTQLYVFGKGAGETSVYATNKAGAVVWSSGVRVGPNLNSIDGMLHIAMPDARIRATTMNGVVMLTGTVGSPDDVEDASRLAQAFVGKEVTVVNRLKTATPMQVSLHVKIAEVNRIFSKTVGVNLLSRDTTGGFLFGIAQGRGVGTIGNVDTASFPRLDASSIYNLPAGSVTLPFNPATGQFVTSPGTSYNLSTLGQGAGKTALAFAGKFLGLDLLAALDLAEADGLVTTLAEPNLVALSGETASFLAGGEIPIPLAQDLGQVTIEFKEYGISLAFTPTVLSDGRISMRVRPEVSELTDVGSVRLNGFVVPGLSTRRAETTVELGSGQSFMIGGLMRNTHNNATDKAPFLGDLPILGALFRSNSFRRNETELMIVVTPYLVKPVSADQITLPTDGYRGATDGQRVIGGQSFDGKTGAAAPAPRRATAAETPPPVITSKARPADALPAPVLPAAEATAQASAPPAIPAQ